MSLRPARTLLALGVPLVCLMLVEGALRVMNLSPPKTRYAQFVEHNPQRGWRNLPGARGWLSTDEFRVALEYNQAAYRGPLHSYAKVRGTRRVVMLGDSFVEGFTVAREERVSERLAARLTQAGAAADAVPLGTAGYGTDQQLLWLISDGLRYEPDVVVVMFYFNDVWYNIASSYSASSKPRFEIDGDSLRLTNVPVPPPAVGRVRERVQRRAAVWLSEHTHLGALASRAVKRSMFTRRVAAALGVVQVPAASALHAGHVAALPDEFRVFARDSQPEVEKAWHATERLLAEIHRRAAAAGAEVILFHVPFRFSIEDSLGGAWLPASRLDLSRVAVRFLQVCERLAVRCIEPTRAFSAAARSRHEPLYFEYDWHWTAAGHDLAATLLAEAILLNDRGVPAGRLATQARSPGGSIDAAAPAGSRGVMRESSSGFR